MSRTSTPSAPKSPPLQVRLAPQTLARVRELAGPGGASEWVRQAVDAALARTDEISPSQPAHEPAQSISGQASAQLLDGLAALADAHSATAVATAQRDTYLSLQLAGVQTSAEQLTNLVRQTAGVLTLLARPLGVPESEIGRLLLSLQSKQIPRK